jgi:hypothetical protein
MHKLGRGDLSSRRDVLVQIWQTGGGKGNVRVTETFKVDAPDYAVFPYDELVFNNRLGPPFLVCYDETAGRVRPEWLRRR